VVTSKKIRKQTQRSFFTYAKLFKKMSTIKRKKISPKLLIIKPVVKSKQNGKKNSQQLYILIPKTLKKTYYYNEIGEKFKPE
jgi:hypothetical protein